MQQEHSCDSQSNSSTHDGQTKKGRIRVRGYRILKEESEKRSRQEEKSPEEIVKSKKVEKASKKKKRQKKNKKLFGRWTEKEESLYRQFVLKSKFEHPTWTTKDTHKKRLNYFIEMSKFIKTRTPEQCKSHDQKMRTKYVKDKGDSEGESSQEKMEEDSVGTSADEMECEEDKENDENEDYVIKTKEIKETEEDVFLEGSNLPAYKPPELSLKGAIDIQEILNQLLLSTKEEIKKGEVAQGAQGSIDCKQESQEVERISTTSENVAGLDEENALMSLYVKLLRKKVLDMAQKMLTEDI